MDRDELARMLEEGLSLEEIGRRVDRHPSTVGYWVAKHGLKAVNGERHSARGAIDAGVLEWLVGEGLTIRDIAVELDRSPSSVRHWLKRHGLRTRRHRRVRPAEVPADATVTETRCPEHGTTTFIRRNDGAWRCLKRRSAAVTARRQRIKSILVAEAGGCCQICGYDFAIEALHFHHVDPASKTFSIASRGVARSLDAARAEAAKCVLLCSNCHAEVEAGRTDLPLRFSAPQPITSVHGRG
jgi:transposase